MGQYVLLLVVALTVGAVVFGVTVLVSGGDPGLDVAEPDGRAMPLPGARPLVESDVAGVRFDTALRGYRMTQVDQALRRAAYDIGYKDELISVLEAEVVALREGRTGDADVLRRAREAALTPVASEPAEPVTQVAPADPVASEPAEPVTQVAPADPVASEPADPVPQVVPAESVEPEIVPDQRPTPSGPTPSGPAAAGPTAAEPVAAGSVGAAERTEQPAPSGDRR